MRPARPGTRNDESAPAREGAAVDSKGVNTASTALRRMLVIDDHAPARRMVVDFFTGRGWHVVSAQDFRSALALATEQQPHVIITEVTLCDARGPHFVRSLKTVIDHDVHIIAVTNVPVALVPREFEMAFAKPADLDAVNDFIEAALT